MSAQKNKWSWTDLEDRGWSEMRVILDRELPEKKRRFVWLPWMGAVAAVILVILLMRPFESGEVPIERTIPPENTGAGVDKPAGVAMGQSNSSDDKKQEVLIADNNAALLQRIESGTDAISEEQNSFVNVEEAGSILSETGEAEKVIAPDNFEGRNVDGKDVGMPLNGFDLEKDNDAVDMVDDSTWPDEQGKTRAGRLRWIPIDTRNLFVEDRARDITVVFLGNEDGEADKLEVKQHKRFNFSVSMGMLSVPKFDKLSWDAGAGLDFNLSKDVTLGTGLYFWKIKGHQEFGQDPNTLRFYGTNGPDAGNRLEMDVDQPTIVDQSDVVSIESISYLRVPVVLRAFTSNRLTPYVGIQWITLLEPSTGLNAESNDFVATVSPGVSQGLARSDWLRKSNVAWNLGLGYTIFGNFHVDASYSQGLESYLNYDIDQGTYHKLHRFFRLGFGYRF